MKIDSGMVAGASVGVVSAGEQEVTVGWLLSNSCDECVELAPHPGCGQMVEVVSRADNLAVADPEHEDASCCGQVTAITVTPTAS